MTGIEKALCDRIISRPDDELARFALADWLEEQGREADALLVRGDWSQRFVHEKLGVPEMIDVGPDSIGDSEFKDCAWVVYWYEAGGYDGSGLAVSMGRDGKLREVDLGHCSCYGPGERDSGTVVDPATVPSLVEYDPNIPGRKRDPRDYQYAQDVAVWKRVSEELKARSGVLESSVSGA